MCDRAGNRFHAVGRAGTELRVAISSGMRSTVDIDSLARLRPCDVACRDSCASPVARRTLPENRAGPMSDALFYELLSALEARAAMQALEVTARAS